MITAFYSSKSGAKNYQYYLDAIANNIANANTNSYKAQNVSFTDLLYTDIKDPENNNLNLQIGNGSRVQIARDMTQGIITNGTGSEDVIINGDGYFAVQNSDSQILYTKSGNFAVREIDGAEYLTTAEGDFVLDANLNKIKVNPDSPLFLAAPGEKQSNAVTLGVFNVNSDSLIRDGSGKYMLSNGSIAVLDNTSTIVQNLVETSNVDLISEMSKMIMAQRGFQINAQMIKTADEIEQYANNLRN